ncbi:protein of unknown function [Amycolatopsis arida]|uniref:TLP18.3, Psb32 and MOLO-1 founding protein of phosphatase n=1 Tax=Amycolatopsis arida TaxID=587909 RepID=A0A1I5UM11_9PSEU|nr:DUF5130 family protein [Amycolatopsis arida]TDX90951.1 uncharacterized protein DUF5130 [Amycolatopsis arida]SFP96353.1 protein of unknown function [Amycolatopsis arida]
MGHGELTHGDVRVDPAELGPGAAVTASGRVSAARMYEPPTPSGLFNPTQLARLDEALTLASRETGLDFTIYLGELGEDSRVGAERLHDSIGERAPWSVLIAVSPGERVVEVVTGAEAHRRLPDRGAKLAVMSMVASFKEGDLIGGLISGLRMMTDQAGPAPRD